MSTKKQHLPEKDCLVCGRPFAWRRKWARDWEAVKYCSKRCRANRAGEHHSVHTANNGHA